MPKTNSTPSFDPAAAFAAFKLPTFDVDALVALQRRNIEAFSTVQKMAADSVKVLTTRQAEIARGAIDEYVAAVGEFYDAKDPKAGVAKQKWPEHVEVIDELPMTTSRKVQKFRLRERIAEAGC